LEGNKTTSGKMRKSMKSIESDSKHRITSDDVIDILQLVTMVSKTIADWMKMTEKHDKEVRYF
jgi:predicted ATP-dependent protease